MRIVKERLLLRCFFLVAACVLMGCFAIGQTAGFEASPTSGCSPLSVVFY